MQEFKNDIKKIQETLQGLTFNQLKTRKGIYIVKVLVDLAGNMSNLIEIEEKN